MKSCIFCKIASGEIPKTPEETRLNNERFMAFLDIHPKAPGHTVLIPKAHYRWFTDMHNDAYAEMMLTAKDLAQRIKKETSADYVHLSIVGKDVPHVHVHLIPRTLTDHGEEV